MVAFIEREQYFTKDVSHELRIPVAESQGTLVELNNLICNAFTYTERSTIRIAIVDHGFTMQDCAQAFIHSCNHKSFTAASQGASAKASPSSIWG